MDKILITGGCGFLGVNLYTYLLERKHQVVILDMDDRMNRLSYAYPKLDYVKCNLGVENFKMPSGVSMVIHLAALPQVDYSYYYPERTLKNNINSLLAVLEETRRCKVPIIFISSVEVYSSKDFTHRFTEDDIVEPVSPYGISKYACENILKVYSNCYGVEYKICRLTNLYGPWQLPDRIIPRCICRFWDDIDIDIDSNVFRDFLFVEDCCQAILEIMNKGRWGEIYNICSGISMSMEEVCGLISNQMGKGGINVNKQPLSGKQRYNYLLLSNSKILSSTNWDITTNIWDGLKMTIDFYCRHRQWLSLFTKYYQTDRANGSFVIDNIRN